ncbi:Calcium release-activated calcium channel protein 1 [Orchesella cincta]|uniref:Calcium release-activated calcium channel protein 1 n=1 Tax=Orchesella cincta TaxID=48709 RepID=A0A1D2NG63_ORCCI|nr:Calcium release-activated calcium channel protein 1 [Orchesella cincta]
MEGHYWHTPPLQNQNHLHDRKRRRLMMTHSKIKAITETSAILAGFGMISLVEFQLKPDTGAPKELVVAFVTSTCWLIAVEMLALFIASFVFPNIEVSSKFSNIVKFMEEGEEPNEDLIDKLQCFVETAWFFSITMGICLFLINMSLICWIKYYDEDYGRTMGIIGTSITAPVVLALMILAVVIHRKVISHHYHDASRTIRELNIDAHLLDMGIQEFQSECGA